MKWLQREGVHYALLLVVLLSTAAVAVVVTLNYVSEVVPHDEFTTITWVIWALTMGFMLIAGAFGLWAVNFAAEAESLRRLGSLVDAMHYIRDGVVALDRQGRASGMNPAAVSIFGTSARNKLLTEFCPSILQQELDALLQSDEPVEIEHDSSLNSEPLTLRFRSQPSKGIVLLLVNDVTALVKNRAHARRTAYLQLVGHMAQGVANDFNDLLCGISGHAALLTRQNGKRVDVSESASAIQDCANRGIQLARQLMQLSGPATDSNLATALTAHHVNAGIDLLEANLPALWTIERSIDPHTPPVNLPSIQLEHLVQSLGLIVADACPENQNLFVSLTSPLPNQHFDLNTSVAAILRISASPISAQDDILTPCDISSASVITSVVNSLISQAGGKLDGFTAPRGVPLYRVLLPEADATSLPAEGSGALVLGLEAYAAHWHILVSSALKGAHAFTDYLKKAGIHTRTANGIVEILTCIETDPKLDAIALNADILGQDRKSLLKAILKLCPDAGIVIQQNTLDEDGINGVVYTPENASPSQLLHAMIEARSRIRSHRTQA